MIIIHAIVAFIENFLCCIPLVFMLKYSLKVVHLICTGTKD
jgi:hypothetical protein